MRLVRGIVVLAVVCLGAKLIAPEARAAGPVTQTFTEVGAHPFTVPAGVTSLHVVAVGAPGGGSEIWKGGRGAAASADLAVTPGQLLNVYVGGPGRGPSPSDPGGFNGGGGGGSEATGGGGASDVRTGGATDLASRLVVAGGGGGAGNLSAGADAGQAALSSPAQCEGGGAGTATSGGKGGTVPGEHDEYRPGDPGILGIGGGSSRGAGGGGGVYGGGGGGAGIREGHEIESCGGGGGSSGFGAGVGAASVSISQSPTASVTFTYVAAAAAGGGGPAGGGGSATVKANLSLPAVQHGKAVVCTARISADRSSLNAKLLWRKSKKSKPLRFGKLTQAPLKKGLHSFTVNLNQNGLKKLGQLGKLKLTLSVTITPPQGAVAAASKQVTLKP